MLRRAALAAAVLALASCAPKLPEGVDEAGLQQAVSDAIGGPTSCLLLAEASTGKIVYRYNTHTACGATWPACEVPGTRTVTDLLDIAVKDGRNHALSCDTQADGSRGVGWAAGPVPGDKGLVYAAAMEGDRAFPGLMMADRLARAFQKAGL